VKVWNIIAIYVYCCLYNKPDIDGDSVQFTLMFIPVVKALQMIFVLTSLLLCARENFFAILIQNFVMMLDLAAETALRTGITAILYLIATVSFIFSSDLTRAGVHCALCSATKTVTRLLRF